MNDNYMNWIFAISMAGAVITAIGFITSRNLPEIQKKPRIRKFAAVALGLLFFGFALFEPFVSPYSNARHFEELKVERINSLEDVADFNRKQAYIISDLNEDVKDLRADLYSVTRYYSNVTKILLATVAVLVFNFAFVKKEEAN
jgi:hypothetical protein